MTREEFCRNEEKKCACERRLVHVGEAVIQIRNLHPAIACEIRDIDLICGMRNLLIHQYEVIDPREIYRAITNSLPLLLEDVRRLQQEL